MNFVLHSSKWICDSLLIFLYFYVSCGYDKTDLLVCLCPNARSEKIHVFKWNLRLIPVLQWDKESPKIFTTSLNLYYRTILFFVYPAWIYLTSDFGAVCLPELYRAVRVLLPDALMIHSAVVHCAIIRLSDRKYLPLTFSLCLVTKFAPLVPTSAL